MDLKNANLPRDIAHEYVGHAEGFLGQALQREFDLKELSDFVETAGASLLGSMYAILRKQEGKEKSEAWLKKVMVSLGSTVRLRGADALVKAEIIIKDMPNKMAKREELHIPGQVAVGPTAQASVLVEGPRCTCEPDLNGACASCLSEITAAMGEAFKTMLEMTKVGQRTESICQVCKAKHGDEALASIVPDVLEKFSAGPDKEASIEQVTALVVQLGMTLGVQEMPMTQEALKTGATK